MQPKVEAEVAFVLGYALDREGLTVAGAMRAVDDTGLAHCGLGHSPASCAAP